MKLLKKILNLKLHDVDDMAFLSMAVICLTILFSTIVTSFLISSEQDFKNLTRLTHEQNKLWNGITQRSTYLMKEGEKGTATLHLIKKIQVRLKDALTQMDENTHQLKNIIKKTKVYWSFFSDDSLSIQNITVSPEMIEWMKRISYASPELILVGFTSWDINKTINLRNGSEIARIDTTIKKLESFTQINIGVVRNIIIILNLVTLIGTIFLWKFFLSPALKRLTEAKQVISERADQAEKFNTLITDLSFEAAKLHRDTPGLASYFSEILLEHLDLELVAISLRAQITGDNIFSFTSQDSDAFSDHDHVREALQEIVDNNKKTKNHALPFSLHAKKTIEINTILSGDTIIGAIAIGGKTSFKKDDPVKLSFFQAVLNLLAMTIESKFRKDIEHSLRSVFDAMDQEVYVFDSNEKTVLLDGKSFAPFDFDRPSNYSDFVRSLKQTTNLTEHEIIEINKKPLKLANNEPIFPLDIKVSDDKIFHVEWRQLPEDEFSVVITDVSSLREAEMARDRHKNQVTAAFLTTSDAVCVLDEDMKIEYHNAAFEKLFPRSADGTYLQTNWIDLLRLNAKKENLENLNNRHLNYWLLEDKGEYQNLETHLSTGQIIIWSRSLTPENRIVLFARNVTELRELLEKNAYSQRMQALGQLTGGIAHDFNNTLMIIQGNLELINKQTNDNAILVHTDPAIRSCLNASSMTEKLLSYSRRQSLIPINISTTVLKDSLIARFDKNKNFCTPVKINKKTDHSIFADPEYLDSALTNLIINAQDAMKGSAGTITIDIEDQYLEKFDPLSDGHYICITITDEGGGFDNEALDHAFEPYFTTKRQDKGTGLGLAMVLGFTQQSGGIATLENQNNGAVVKLYLPCGPILAIHKKKELDQGFPVTEKLFNKSFLVVEDTEFGVDFISEVLERYNAKVTCAKTVSEASEIIKNMTTDFDFIISDIDLPDGEGFDILSEFNDFGPPPCLFITGLVSVDFQNQALKYNAEILKKPFTIKQLITSIDNKMAKITSPSVKFTHDLTQS